ncbi:response regulator [Luteibaculum oceani]|uniref:Response regulator n=1 Tax=Luteibaculum oceani TaxID=1294296 RepID=A0A5C6V915_9FLAO|nr:response regulator [Luteibaculum oceani]TXC81609.1 response regulator [Luteibaculum oceani]
MPSLVSHSTQPNSETQFFSHYRFDKDDQSKFETAIIIDDNRNDLLFHKMILKKEGFASNFCTFVSGKAALTYLNKTLRAKLDDNPEARYAIFLDLIMPRMDGFDFLELFDELDEDFKSHFKIYLVTNSTNPIDLQKASKSNSVFGFVRKPITKKIIDVIRLNC